MIQVVELRKREGQKPSQPSYYEYEVGNGQQIESEMANDLGLKVFRFYQPGDYKGATSYMMGLPFQSADVDNLVAQIKKWYSSDCQDLSTSEVYSSDRGAVSFHNDSDDESDCSVELISASII